jgi:hypothetical protein
MLGAMSPYAERFPVGSNVCIAERDALEHFRQTWTLHTPLLPEQLPFAEALATVASVGFNQREFDYTAELC